MRDLEAIAAALELHFDAMDASRERVLALSREVVRASASAIRAAHRGDDPGPHLAVARGRAGEMRAAAASFPELLSTGYVQSAFQELAEAHLVQAHARGDPVPGPGDVPVPPDAWVLGLGDFVGELRRFALDAIVRGDVGGAVRHVERMDEVYVILMRFDYPAALLDVRRKQDAARGLLERTRGEVAVAVRGRSMEEGMARLSALLEAGAAAESRAPRS